METAEQRLFGFRSTQWLAIGIFVILVFAAWSVWIRPVVTLYYYRECSVFTARAGLCSEDELVRLAAARGLGCKGLAANDAVPDLIIALSDNSSQVASSAAWALGSILSSQPSHTSPLWNEVVIALIEALRHGNGEVRRYAAYAFSRIGAIAQTAIPRLTELLDDDHMAYMAARALGEIGSAARDTAPRIAALLTSSHAGERAEAARALSKLQPLSKDIIIAIEGLLEDNVDFVRAVARDVLQDIRAERGRAEREGRTGTPILGTERGHPSLRHPQ